jgi:TRAP-type uncharacterized transport system fused permease subunit
MEFLDLIVSYSVLVVVFAPVLLLVPEDFFSRTFSIVAIVTIVCGITAASSVYFYELYRLRDDMKAFDASFDALEIKLASNCSCLGARQVEVCVLVCVCVCVLTCVLLQDRQQAP